MAFKPISGSIGVAASLAIAMLAACAGMTAGRGSPGVVENGAFKPTLPPAANYGPDPSRTCPQRGVYGVLQDQMNARFKGKQVPQPDGRLCALAETLLGWQMENDELPPESVRQFLSSYFGLPTTVRQLLITTIDSDQELQLADALSPPLASFAESAQVPRYGLVTQRLKTASGRPSGSAPPSGSTRAVLVLQDQPIEMSPVPRALPVGGDATVEGRALGSIDKPKIAISDVMGKLQSVPPSGDKSFRAQLHCGDKPGRILVRITGEKEGADVLLATFSVGCGSGQLATSVPMPAAQATAAAADPAAAEQQLTAQINADRTALGLKPLKSDPGLAKIARGISENRAKGKGVSSSELTQAIHDADISATVIAESAVQAFDEPDAYSRLSNSPEDRSNLMTPDLTDFGIGVSRGPTIGNQPTVIVTGLFVKQLPPPDPDDIKAKLYQGISRRRSDARAGALTKDEELERIAQAYATAMAKSEGKVPKEKVAEIEAPLYKSFATVNELGGLKQDPLEFAEEPGVVGDAKVVGVGVGIGPSPQFGKNSTYVVILLGKKHAAKATSSKPPKKKKKKK